jgi:hypothetical protein
MLVRACEARSVHPRPTCRVAFIAMRGIFAFLRIGACGRITLDESVSGLYRYDQYFLKLSDTVNLLLSIKYTLNPKYL